MPLLPITATFIDEISHDIPHQNWGIKEWREDFRHMKNMGIDTVVLIRCGYRRWLTYPSKYLISKEGCYTPPVDLVALFLELSSEFGFDFYFGLYDSGRFWSDNPDLKKETEINRYVIDEVGKRYAYHANFKGWYLCHELSELNPAAVNMHRQLAHHCKATKKVSKTLISPYIKGNKAVPAHSSRLRTTSDVTMNSHEKEWTEIFDGLKDDLDAVAFQDGHVDYHELSDYLEVNKKICDKFGISSWSNLETIDRDMPIKFLPIKWDKLHLKLTKASEANVYKIITFEFSHFMSPQSSYIQARHLYNRYTEFAKSNRL